MVAKVTITIGILNKLKRTC